MILTLVSSVATNYLTLRGLDEQLVIANRTLGTYAESVRLYQLQFKYGQTSQMTVSQAQSQYETAAAQIPLIESQIAQTENALSVLLGRNPGPIPRGKSIYDLALPTVPAGVPSDAARAAPGPAAVGAVADRGQRADRRRPRALLSDDLAHRRVRRRERATVEPVLRTRARVELHGPGRRADLHVRRRRAARSRRPRRRSGRRSTTTGFRSRTRSPTSTTRSSPTPSSRTSSRRRVASSRRSRTTRASRRLQYDGGYTSYTTVLQAEQALFPAELTLASVRASVFASAANTYKAMGGGWVTTADTMTTDGSQVPLDEQIAKQPIF